MKYISNALALLVFACSSFCFSKVLIFTYSYNRPDFIELQDKTFKKFLTDEYEFVVFNDATKKDMKQKIKNTCKNLGIKCLTIPQKIHNGTTQASQRNCNVVQYSLDVLGYNHDDILVLLDSDMFLIKEFSIRDAMKNYDIAGVKQGDLVNYLWIGLVFMDMRSMPNKKTITFNCGNINGVNVDTGGTSHYYLKNNPTLRVNYLDTTYTHLVPQDAESLQTLGHSPEFIRFILNDPGMQFHCNNTFLHHGAGTNWCGSPSAQLAHKKSCLDEFINTLVQ